MKTKRSSSGLMLVEDPKFTIQVLCNLPDYFNWQMYKDKYEQMKGLSRPISRQHADTHFYSLSIFGIIEQVDLGRGKYKLSISGKVLCKYLFENRIFKFKNCLANILLNNQKKGEIFRSFFEFVSNKGKVNYDEIHTFLKKINTDKNKSAIEIMARSLIAWSEEAGLIERDTQQKIIWPVKQEPKKDISIEEFWNFLCKKYLELKKSEIFGIEKIYVDILQLRTAICLELNIENEEFNKLIIRLLDSEKGDNIKLYGAPTSFFSGRENFSYMNRVYAYITIRCT